MDSCRLTSPRINRLYTRELVRQPVPYRFEPRGTYSWRVFTRTDTRLPLFSLLFSHIATADMRTTRTDTAETSLSSSAVRLGPGVSNRGNFSSLRKRCSSCARNCLGKFPLIAYRKLSHMFISNACKQVAFQLFRILIT